MTPTINYCGIAGSSCGPRLTNVLFYSQSIIYNNFKYLLLHTVRYQMIVARESTITRVDYNMLSQSQPLPPTPIPSLNFQSFLWGRWIFSWITHLQILTCNFPFAHLLSRVHWLIPVKILQTSLYLYDLALYLISQFNANTHFYYMAMSQKDWKRLNSRTWLAKMDIDHGLDFPI